jgi:UDP-N-acetylglucosamine--dolichyl-phosphate N-acetylglucosaminephosphotransferase
MTISATSTFDHRLLFAIFLSATIAILAGIIDDLFKLGKTTLIIITFLIGMPIVTFRAGSTLVYLTPFGPADLGWIFWALVPFVFAFLMNGVNIYAGFNGLEAGLGATSSMTLGICAFLYGSLESAVSLFALGAALLAFLRWNWYPAKVFIGGSGTFLIGSVLASSIIVGSIKVVGVIALFPYLINFTLRAIDRFDWSVGETWSNGIVTSARRNALWALFMYRKHTSEKRVTLHCICFHIFFSLGAIIYAYYHTRIVLL